MPTTSPTTILTSPRNTQRCPTSHRSVDRAGNWRTSRTLTRSRGTGTDMSRMCNTMPIMINTICYTGSSPATNPIGLSLMMSRQTAGSASQPQTHRSETQPANTRCGNSQRMTLTHFISSLLCIRPRGVPAYRAGVKSPPVSMTHWKPHRTHLSVSSSMSTAHKLGQN